MVTNGDGSNHGSATTQISVTDLAGATAAVTPSASYTFTGGAGPTTDPGYESPFGPSADSQSGTINGTVYGGVTYSPDGTKIAYSQDTYTNYAYDFSAATPTQSGTLSSQVFVYEGGHDILLAENLPAESYIDVGNRAFFLENNVTALGATPDGSPATNSLVDYCRPYVADGPVVAAVRARLEANAGAARAPVRLKSANEA